MTSQNQPTFAASLSFQHLRRALSKIRELYLGVNLPPQCYIKALRVLVASFFVFIAFLWVLLQSFRQNLQSLFGYHSIVSSSFTFGSHLRANVPNLCRINCGQGLFLDLQFLYCYIFRLKAVIGVQSSQSTQFSLQRGSPRVTKPSNLWTSSVFR